MELIIWILFSALCYKIAEEKNRDVICWAILGFLFSLIALIVLVCLPEKEV